MINKIVALYCLVDALLKGIEYQEDSRRQMSDREAIVAARYFAGNHRSACQYLSESGLIPQMLSESRFNR